MGQGIVSRAAHPLLLLCSIDNDLVQEDSEFKGSRQFGMSYANPQVLAVTAGHLALPAVRQCCSTAGMCIHGTKSTCLILRRAALPRLALFWKSRATRPLMTAGYS